MNNPENFFDGGYAIHGFLKTVLNHGSHAVFYGDRFNIVSIGLMHNRVANFFVYFQNFVDADSPKISATIARFTTLAILKLSVIF